MKKICIDLTNLVPGKGGAGGGIATYGKELILGIDALLENGEDLRGMCEISVLLNTDTYKDLKLKNIKAIFFDVNNQSIFSRMYWLQVRLPRFLKKEKIDLLHRVLSEMPLFKVCKYVVTVHDFMFEFYLKRPDFSKYLQTKEKLKFRFLNGMLSKAIITSDLVITNSNSTSNDVRSRFRVADSQISSILLGYSPSSYLSNQPRKNDSDQIIRFGVVAAFHPHKGHIRVVKLAKRMVELGNENKFHFYFRGSPVYQEYYDIVKKEISDNGLEAYFTFEQYDPTLTLADIYDKYSATVLLSDYEGFGLPVIESQAFCRPVICSKIPVFKEILGDTAFFLPDEPTDEEINKLLSDLNNSEYLNLLVEKGRNNASKFTWSITCENTVRSYLDLLAK